MSHLTGKSNITIFLLSLLALFLLIETVSAVNVNTCQLINAPGTYDLTINLAGAPIAYAGGIFGISASCIKITANNVDLNCHGFTITNNGTANAIGIVIAGSAVVDYTNVTTHNCPQISGYKMGIGIDNSIQDRIDNTTTHSNTQYGIYLYKSSNNNVTNNIVYNHTGNGILLYTSSNNNTLINNKAYDTSGGHGFHLSSNCRYNTLRNNEAYNNADGFRIITGGHNNTFINNTAHDNTQQGFDFLGGTNGLVMINNTAYNHQQRGIYFSSVRNSRIEGSTVYNSSWRGFDLLNSDNNVFRNNILYGNAKTNNNDYDTMISSNSNDNVFYNTIIYTNKTGFAGIRYLKQIATANPTNNFTNLIVCYNETAGCVDWDFLNLSNATLNRTNFMADPWFVSLNDSNTQPFNTSANITVYKNLPCNAVGYYKEPGFPQSRASIVTNGTEFIPAYESCSDATGITTFSVSSFSGYATGPANCTDIDGDGFGTGPNKIGMCTHPESPDCDDTNPNILPPYFGMMLNNDTYLCSGIYNVTGWGNAIQFNRSNIKLVCQNTTINNNVTANALTAIRSIGHSNIEITGCTIQHYNRSYGIRLRDLINANITNNTFIHNSQGFLAQNTTNVFCYNNSFYNHNGVFPNGFGLIAQQGVYNWTIRNNYFTGSASADLVLYDTGSGNLVENNTCNSPGPGGIISMGMNDTIIRHNTAFGHTGAAGLSNDGFGIITANLNLTGVIVPEYRTHAYNNTVYNNDVGIAILGNNSIVENNIIYGNLIGVLSEFLNLTAVPLTSRGHNNTIRNNNIYNNNDGIYINDSNYNTFSRNTLINNPRYGIYCIKSYNSTINNNQIQGSNYSIYFDEDNSTQSCNGAVVACGSFTSPITCNNQIGCFWLLFPPPGQCTGVATPCNQLTNAQCPQQQSCSLFTNYYNDQWINITNNNLSNGLTGMNLSGRWTKALLFTKVIKGGYHNILNNRILNFNTGIFMTSNHNNITNNIFSGNTKDIISQGGRLVINNQIKNTTLNTVRTSFNYTGDFDITHGSMQGIAPYGKASIRKFIDISNNTNLVPNPFVNLTIYYTDADLNNIKDESTLRLYRHNNNQWAVVPGSTVNTTGNYITADLTNFSMFGAFGQSKNPRGPAGGGGGGGAGISPYYKQSPEQIQEQTTEWPTANIDDDKTKEKESKEKPTVKAPEIKTDEQKDKTELKILKYIPSTKAIIPGIILIMGVFAAVAYFFMRTPPAKPPEQTQSRRKDKDLENMGFKVKK